MRVSVLLFILPEAFGFEDLQILDRLAAVSRLEVTDLFKKLPWIHSPKFADIFPLVDCASFDDRAHSSVVASNVWSSGPVSIRRQQIPISNSDWRWR